MARRRLTPPAAAADPATAPANGGTTAAEAPFETKSRFQPGDGRGLEPWPSAAHYARPAPASPSAEPAPPPRPRAPIAQIAGGLASEAALEEMGAALASARREGRLIQALPLAAVEAGHILRDRLESAATGEDMEALVASLRASGQRTPIEVEDLGGGRFGLISGWRRLTALRRLASEDGPGARPATVLAVVRAPAEAADAYLAMVEENEIRAGLSFWERARIVRRAAEAGVFADEGAALRGLFGAASKSRRSKIGAFVPVVAALDGALPFPEAVSERLGLALAAALKEDAGFGAALAAALGRERPASPEEQAACLSAALDWRTGETEADAGETGVGETGAVPQGGAAVGRAAARASAPAPRPPSAGRPREGEAPRHAPVRLTEEGGRLVIDGPGAADPAFRAALQRWLAGRRG